VAGKRFVTPRHISVLSRDLILIKGGGEDIGYAFAIERFGNRVGHLTAQIEIQYGCVKPLCPVDEIEGVRNGGHHCDNAGARISECSGDLAGDDPLVFNQQNSLSVEVVSRKITHRNAPLRSELQ